jgi:hypothetical protein
MAAQQETAGERLADAAASLVGTAFRLHGRDPRSGLDCIGLVAEAMRRCGFACEIPQGYRLRNIDIDIHLACLAPSGLVPASGAILAGDLILVRPGPAQHHLLVASVPDRFIHAHAGLRRVVAMPGPLPWPVLHHWRFAPTTLEG